MDARLRHAVLNMSMYHHEHEKYYSRKPLEQAVELQRISGALKTLADRWAKVAPVTPAGAMPMQGCEDLNEPVAIQENGILFMEGEGEPVEIARMKRSLADLADDAEQTGPWLARAMESSWQSALALIPNPALADLLGERHRIITNDWQNAATATLSGRIVRRALDILGQVDFSPEAVRADLAGARISPAYLHAACELIDRAADLSAESATIVHDSERRWRVFRGRVEQIGERAPEGNGAQPAQEKELAAAKGEA